MHQTDAELLEIGRSLLMRIKDSDIRIITLRQGFESIDKGIHIGGAFSATVPLVSLFYGGFMNLDIDDPAKVGQDQFVLSKGHSVSTMASIYADLGYFEASLLVGSRAEASLLNGHPGPLLPGVQVATGPLGQGLAVAQGMALAGKRDPGFNVFCLTGDGELQEGIVWEAFMYAPQRRLDNLCVIVDKNEGQLDDHQHLLFSMHKLPSQIESFGWRTLSIDGTSYSAVLGALETFLSLPKDGRPTAIICNTRKGFGAFSEGLNKHKITIAKEVYEQELVLQTESRKARAVEFETFRKRVATSASPDIVRRLDDMVTAMSVELHGTPGLVATRARRSRPVPVRDKSIKYDRASLPMYSFETQVAASDVVKKCMAVFARDARVVTVDSDLGSTSGLGAGVSSVDQGRALNVGIAEANMMCIGEAYAALGYNVWVSTFCPFFDWKVLRRIAVSQQERIESIQSSGGWLSEGHGLDLTFLATAPNLETATNGATHMGNDDTIVYGGVAGLKIIDVSCPNQLVAIMRWIMDGNRGLNYVRILRAPSAPLYAGDYHFEYAKAYRPFGPEQAVVNFVSSGRGVHECLEAARLLAADGISASVYDMPSFDPVTMERLLGLDSLTVVAEQNNGYLWNETGRLVMNRAGGIAVGNCLPINLNQPDGSYRFIHSATYQELLDSYGLAPEKIVEKVRSRLGR